MRVATVIIALALLMGTMIRTGGNTSDQGVNGGLVVLRETDRLILFEDHSNRGPDDDAAQFGVVPGLGQVLGPFEAEAVARALPLSEATRDIFVSVDLYLWDQTSLPTISVNGDAVAMTMRERAAPAGGPRRIHGSARLDVPGGAASLTIEGAADGRWALDNLLVIAHQPDDR